MSNINVKKKLPAFNYPQSMKIETAMAKLYGTQFGALMDSFTADDLRLLFVPPHMRAALALVYSLETSFNARGAIHFDLCTVVGPIKVFDDEAITATVEKCWFKFSFDRATEPNGFVTPEPVFGSGGAPLAVLQPAPELLNRRFIENLSCLATLCAEWAVVKWVFQQLNRSLRTPQQMRYVWPATYPLSTAAELDMDLMEPSARAGMNAVPAENIRAYLRDSNDVVARSALFGINGDYLKNYAAGRVAVAHQQIRLGNTIITHTQG